MFRPLYGVAGRVFYYVNGCHWEKVSEIIYKDSSRVFTIYKADETGEYALQEGTHGSIFYTFPTHGRYFRTESDAKNLDSIVVGL